MASFIAVIRYALLETFFCIPILPKTGLIQSNTQYDNLLYISSLCTRIVDNSYQTKYASENAPELSMQQMSQAEAGPVELPGGHILSSAPVTGGHILWTEDISNVFELREQLRSMGSLLSEEKDILQAEISLKERKTLTDIRNLLYDKLAKKLNPQFVAIEKLTDSSALTIEQQQTAMKKLCVYGAYIKRCCNLIILNEEQESISTTELVHCLRESAEYIRQYGADCAVSCSGESFLPSAQLMLAYDFFQELVESSLETLSALLIDQAIKPMTLFIVL